MRPGLQAAPLAQRLEPGVMALTNLDVDLAAACAATTHLIRQGRPALQAVVEACNSVTLEGQQTESACMTSDGKFGAVAALRGVGRPAIVALAVHATPHNLLAGFGAAALARAIGAAPEPPAARPPSGDSEGNLAGRGWLGFVARDAAGFAACMVADTAVEGKPGAGPLIGCGLFVSPAGAALVGGAAPAIVRGQLAYQIHASIGTRTLLGEASNGLPLPPDVGALVMGAGAVGQAAGPFVSAAHGTA